MIDNEKRMINLVRLTPTSPFVASKTEDGWIIGELLGHRQLEGVGDLPRYVVFGKVYYDDQFDQSFLESAEAEPELQDMIRGYHEEWYGDYGVQLVLYDLEVGIELDYDLVKMIYVFPKEVS